MSSDIRFFTGILPCLCKHNSPVWYRSLLFTTIWIWYNPVFPTTRSPPPPSFWYVFLVLSKSQCYVKKMIKSSNLLLAYTIRFFFCLTLSPFINSSISCRFQFNKNTGFISYCNHTYNCMQVHVRAKVSIVLCWPTIAYYSEQAFQQSNKFINTW